jgi:amidase
VNTDKPQSASADLFNSATYWLRMLSERRIGAVELLNLHLSQIDKYHDSLNLVVARDVDGALEAARAADNSEPSKGSVLRGLPMTIKDTFEVTGMPATAGLPFLAEHRPQNDADAVARLKAAGAVVFGKTNVPAAAMDWQSFNDIYGVSNNPWNIQRTPGGSSGGAAGALAAGFTPLELGSDLAGSIRIPAHFCGVYGHKPSYGLVPGHGHIPPMPGQLATFELGVCGPMARSADDLELALDVLAAPGELHRPAWSVAIPPSRHERLEDFRVAAWVDDTYTVDSRYRAAIESYVDDLRSIGVTVDVAARPAVDPARSHATYLTVLFSIAGAGLPDPARQSIFDAAATLTGGDDSYVARLASTLRMSHGEYFAINHQREVLRQAWRAFFTCYDLVLAPVSPTVAFEHDHSGLDRADPVSAAQERTLTVNGQHRPYLDTYQWPSLALVADLPATAVPTGRFVDGMPAGVQLIGPYLEDRTLLRFAQLVERELGSAPIPPGCL